MKEDILMKNNVPAVLLSLPFLYTHTRIIHLQQMIIVDKKWWMQIWLTFKNESSLLVFIAVTVDKLLPVFPLKKEIIKRVTVTVCPPMTPPLLPHWGICIKPLSEAMVPACSRHAHTNLIKLFKWSFAALPQLARWLMGLYLSNSLLTRTSRLVLKKLWTKTGREHGPKMGRILVILFLLLLNFPMHFFLSNCQDQILYCLFLIIHVFFKNPHENEPIHVLFKMGNHISVTLRMGSHKINIKLIQLVNIILICLKKLSFCTWLLCLSQRITQDHSHACVSVNPVWTNTWPLTSALTRSRQPVGVLRGSLQVWERPLLGSQLLV